MPTISVKNMAGQDAGSLALSDAVFAAPQNEVVVREAVNAFRSNQRQGTHSTKTRAFVSGGGKKPWKQKHTGRARAGSSRSPLWRGGAIVFGPLPRDYREKVNRKKRQAALRAAFSSLAEEGRLIAIENIDISAEPKSRKVIALIDALGAEGRVLFVTAGVNELLVRAARNIPHVSVAPTNALNIYEILVNDTIVLTKDALAAIEEMLG